MAKPLVFQFGDRDLAFSMNKLDRSKLYGYKTIEAVDNHNLPCELATLSNDGTTIVASGGTAFGYVTPDGQWRDKSSLTPVDATGQPIQPVPSSFSAPIKLFDTVTTDDYFQHNIKSIYQLTCEGEFDDLKDQLDKGTIFSFPYSYRGGLEADVGFLLSNTSGDIFLALGSPTKANFISLQQTSEVIEDETNEEDADFVDFDMT